MLRKHLQGCSQHMLYHLSFLPTPNLSNKFYLKAKHQLHRSPPGQDAMISVADKEEVQDTQEEHKSCGDPQMEGSDISTGLTTTS